MRQIKISIAAIAMLFGVMNLISAQTRGYHNAPYTRYEADVATGGGESFSSTDQNNIAFEASERRVVYLANGQSREWTNVVGFRGIVVRAAGASQRTGHTGQDVSARVYINGTLATTLTFYANRGWKNLQADPNPNYGGISNSNPRMRYDEARYLHSASVPAGATIRIESQGNLYLDFIEIENVTETPAPGGYAVYNGDRNNRDALQNFINNNTNIYLPAGTYNIGGTLEVNGTKNIQGAGMWFTNINFTNGGGNQGGFWGFSRNGNLRDVALTRTTGYSRSNSYKGINGVWGRLERLWVERFECGAWFGNYSGGWGDPFADGMVIEHCRFRNNYADGINFCLGTRNSVARFSNFRNNGDDDMAIWPAGDFNRGTCSNNTFEYNTAEHCWFASSCALYGGQGNTFQHIIIKDNWEVGIRSNTTFPGYGFTGGNNVMNNIEVIRCGTSYGAYGAGMAAIDLQGGTNVRLTCVDVTNPLGNAMHRGAGNASACGVRENGGLIGGSNNTDTNCTCTTATVNSVTISGCTGGNLNSGSTRQLTATVSITGTGLANTVTWESSNNAIATVSNTGLVTAGNTAGTVIITARSTADPGKTDECSITVVVPNVSVISVSLPNASVNLNENITLAPVFNPANATNKNVTYSIVSGGANINLNTSTGIVTGTNVGTAVVRVTTQDGNRTADATITVLPPPACTAPVIVKTTTAPVIDGTKDAVWNDAPAAAINNRLFGTSNMDGFAAQWKAFYDNTNIYLLVEITKPTAYPGLFAPINTAQWWETSDAIEIYFDGDNSKNNNGNTDLRAYRFRYNLPVEMTSDIDENTEEILNNVTVQYTAIDNRSWFIEVSIPLADINVTPTAGTIIGFDVAVNVVSNDSGTGRQGYYTTFTNTDPPVLNASQYGNVELSECVSADIDVTSVTLNKNTTSLCVNATETLTATVLPANATNPAVTWSSSNTAIATVNASGQITAVSAGQTTIRVTSNADGTKFAECVVTVNAAKSETVPVTICENDLPYVWRGITFPLGTTSNQFVYNRFTSFGCDSIVTLNLTVNSAIALTETLTICENELPYTWRDQVFAVGTTSQSFTYRHTNALGCDSIVTLNLTVNPAPAQPSVITGNDNPTQGTTGLTYSVTNVTGVTYTWEVPAAWTITAGQNSNSITVSVGALAAGGTIRVTPSNTCGNGTAQTLTVTTQAANVPVTSVSLNKNSTTLCVSGTETLTATVLPNNATNPALTWSSNNTTVATVDENGQVTAVSAGTATITVTSVDDETKFAECVVMVNAIPAQPTEITGTSNALLGVTGLTYSAPFVAGVTYEWSVPTGWTITAGQGTSSITVSVGMSAVGGTISVTPSNTCGTGTVQTFTVTITDTEVNVTGVSLNKTSVELCAGEEETLIVTVTPNNATNENVTWTTSSRTVAIVDNSGQIITVGYGTATITVTTEDGGFEASCEVTVKGTPTVATPTPVSTILCVGDLIEVNEPTVNQNNGTLVSAVWKLDGNIINPETYTVTLANNNQQLVYEVTNECGTTTSTGVTITVNDVPAQPSEINGSANPVFGSSVTYSVTNVTGVIYEWTLPDGFTITAGQGTNSITVSVSESAVSGSIVVVATNDCGNSPTRRFSVTPQENIINVTGISVNPTSLTFTVGDAPQTITATITPNDATNQAVTWTSSNPAVATVVDGVVTPVGEGTATITATAVDGNLQATCAVTVNPEAVLVTGISVNPTTIAFTMGDAPQTVTATITPNNATNQAVNWTSSNPAVATVVNGVVTPVGIGSATITATTVDGGHEATCVVTVSPAEVPVTGISVNPTSMTFILGDAARRITATITPFFATNTNIIWTSSNPSVANVNDGLVTPGVVGTTTITARTEDGNFTATCIVTVLPPITIPTTGITLNKNNMTIEVGVFDILIATVAPTFATDKTVTWTSSNNSVVTIDANGKLTAVGGGTVTITARTVDGHTATVQVTVVVPVESISVVQNISIEIGEQYTLTPSFNPTNATNRDVIYSIAGGSNFVSVNPNTGVITGLAVGEARVRATSVNGGHTAICIVTVTNNISRIGEVGEENAKSIIAYQNTIEVSNLAAGEIVSIYNLIGAKIYTFKASNSTEYITSLQPGMYIVVIEGTIVKEKVFIK